MGNKKNAEARSIRRNAERQRSIQGKSNQIKVVKVVSQKHQTEDACKNARGLMRIRQERLLIAFAD